MQTQNPASGSAVVVLGLALVVAVEAALYVDFHRELTRDSH